MRAFSAMGMAVSVLVAASTARAQAYSSPLGCDGCINYWYYVDHGGRDWNCLFETYADHHGTDFSLRGGNLSIAGGYEVVAAARGVVTVATDGNYDQCTACGGPGCGVNTPGGGFANHVVVDHGGHDTTYGHMRTGSIVVQVGQTVECGQVLGQIGSSGCSTGAHLHFQPRPAGGSYVNPQDPFVGACSPTPSSLWANQGPHRGVPGRACDAAPPTPTPPVCPADTYTVWTCTPDGKGRRRCIGGVDSTEPCSWGCTAMPTGTDDTCALPPDADGDGSRIDTDCNDAVREIHPGAAETCGDGIDQDCNGGDASCPAPPVSGVPSGAGGAPPIDPGTPPLGGAAGTPNAPSGVPSVATGGLGSAGGWSASGGFGAAGGWAAGGGWGAATGGVGTAPLAGSEGNRGDPAPELGCTCRVGRRGSSQATWLAIAAFHALTLSRRARRRS